MLTRSRAKLLVSSFNIKRNEYTCPSNMYNFLNNDRYTDVIERHIGKNYSENQFTLLGNEFEQNLENHLINYFGTNNTVKVMDTSRFDNSKINDTVRYIKNGVPIIFQAPVACQENKLYGVVDMLIKVCYIPFILPNFDISGFESDKYVIVDFKYKTLGLKSGGVELRDSYIHESMQLFIYSQCLKEHVVDKSIIIGRNYKWCENGVKYQSPGSFTHCATVNIGDRFEHLSQVLYEYNEWKTYSVNNHDSLVEMIETCSVPINMKVKNQDNIKKYKNSIAHKNKYIGLLPSISYDQLCNCINNYNVSSIMDDNIHPEMFGISSEGAKYDMISNYIYSIKNSKSIFPPKNEWKYLPTFTNDDSTILHLDFETISDTDNTDVERTDLTMNQTIFMIGITNQRTNEYVNFTCDNYSREEEHRIIKEFIEYVDRQYNPKIIYWYAEEMIWRARKPENLPDITCEWYDIYKLFKSNNVVLKDSFSYSIKNVSKSMNDMGMIPFAYEDCSTTDGLMAMMNALKYYRGEIKDVNIMNEIIYYNKCDCDVMMHIFKYITE